jgi:pimeloyl-ACP methyl ester carboxylesterase
VQGGQRGTRTLVYLHGIESHGAWFLPVAERLARFGFTVHLLDRRGSGLNRGEEVAADAASAEILLEDVQRFRTWIGDRDLTLAGLSWGGKLALASAIRRPGGVNGVVLIAPGLVPRVDLPRRDKLAVLADLALGRGRRTFAIPIDDDMFTRRPEHLAYIGADPARLGRVTSRFLLASRALDRIVARGVKSLECAVLLLLAGEDRIVDNARVERLLSALPAGRLRTVSYPGADHSLQFERPLEIVREIVRFGGS